MLKVYLFSKLNFHDNKYQIIKKTQLIQFSLITVYIILTSILKLWKMETVIVSLGISAGSVSIFNLIGQVFLRDSMQNKQPNKHHLTLIFRYMHVLVRFPHFT